MCAALQKPRWWPPKTAKTATIIVLHQEARTSQNHFAISKLKTQLDAALKCSFVSVQKFCMFWKECSLEDRGRPYGETGESKMSECYLCKISATTIPHKHLVHTCWHPLHPKPTLCPLQLPAPVCRQGPHTSSHCISTLWIQPLNMSSGLALVTCLWPTQPFWSLTKGRNSMKWMLLWIMYSNQKKVLQVALLFFWICVRRNT